MKKHTNYQPNRNKGITKKDVSSYFRLSVLTILTSLLTAEALGRDTAQEKQSFSVQKSVAENPTFTKKGKVISKNNESLVGVTILKKGTKIGTITNVNGEYQIEAKIGDILVISYTGFKTQVLTVSNNQTETLTMEENQQELKEVVVTALGIKRETKALTYNLQEIKAKEITMVKDANFMNSLTGKLAGVTINSSSAGIGGSVKVVMRGNKSIAGNNNALYVVDGIPLPSLMTEQPSDAFTGMGQSGDGISNFNPDDVESMSILSGASAAALYGSEAANGVVLITTKQGKKGVSLSFTNNTSFSSPLILPEFQNTYSSLSGDTKSWGPKLKSPTDYDPAKFFQTGFQENNSISLSTGSETNQLFASFGSIQSRGIVQNNNFERHNASLRNTSSMLNNLINLDLGFMYMKVNEQNMLAQGQYLNPLVPIYLFPRGDDIRKYETYERYDPSRNFKTQYWPYGDLGMQAQNPYWITNRGMFNNRKNRYLMNAAVKINLSDWINFTARVKLDVTNSLFERKYYASTLKLFASESGGYRRVTNDTYQTYLDALLNINKYIGDFSITSTLGASYKDTKYDEFSQGGKLSSVVNLFTLSNLDKTALDIDFQKGFHDQIQAIFGTAQIGFKGMAYLDITARNDWASALVNTKTRSIFYPSVGLSAIVTEMLPRSKTLSFLKVRTSYSEVGNAPQRFLSIQTYPVVNGSPQTTTWLPNPDLKPELTKSYELGFNAKFFGNKVTLDLTLYKSSTYNQLFNTPLSVGSGYTHTYVNAGRIDNKGIELNLGLNQAIGSVNWTSNIAYTLNRNKIVQLRPEMYAPNGELLQAQKTIDLGGADGYQMKLTEGGSIGDIYVNTLRQDEHGYVSVDINSQTVIPERNKYIYAGNAAPKYILGWRNDFEWKGISINFLIYARVGGVGVSATQAVLDQYGVSKASAIARDNGGALVNGNLIPAQSYYNSIGGSGFVGSQYVYSATNVRLSELSLGYNIPINKYAKWIRELKISLIGRNLLMIYNKAPFDPESTASTATYYQGFDYFQQPSLRNIGFSLNVKF